MLSQGVSGPLLRPLQPAAICAHHSASAWNPDRLRPRPRDVKTSVPTVQMVTVHYLWADRLRSLSGNPELFIAATPDETASKRDPTPRAVIKPFKKTLHPSQARWIISPPIDCSNPESSFLRNGNGKPRTAERSSEAKPRGSRSPKAIKNATSRFSLQSRNLPKTFASRSRRAVDPDPRPPLLTLPDESLPVRNAGHDYWDR